MNVGLTSYRGYRKPQIREADDPAIGAYYETTRYKGFEDRIRREAAAEGIEVEGIRRVPGLWEGSYEPAASIDFRGDPVNIRRKVREWRKIYNQDAAMEFTADASGPGALYVLDGVGDRERTKQLMSEHGFRGGRFDGDRLEIADPDRSGAGQVREMAEKLGVRVRARAGWVEFIS